MTSDRLRLPFAEQIAFLRQKQNLPTATWRDIERDAHDRAFVVAGAMNADLLDDLRQAVDDAVAGGDTLADFRKKFGQIIERRGWRDFTGDDRSEAQPKGGRGLAWRTRTIYNTNVATSYAAGRWQQLNDPALLKERPYWRYVHSDLTSNPRPLHKRWGDAGLTLRHDHPFWKTHFPPNGWGCRCRVTAVREPKRNDATAPPDGWDVRDYLLLLRADSIRHVQRSHGQDGGDQRAPLAEDYADAERQAVPYTDDIARQPWNGAFGPWDVCGLTTPSG